MFGAKAKQKNDGVLSDVVPAQLPQQGEMVTYRDANRLDWPAVVIAHQRHGAILLCAFTRTGTLVPNAKGLIQYARHPMVDDLCIWYRQSEQPEGFEPNLMPGFEAN